jgi:hypothetical protein
MRLVRVDKNREVEVPTTWAEGFDMLTASMNRYHDRRGGNLERASVAARVAFGLFGERFLAADPTDALVFLLQEICAREGAGLEVQEEPKSRLKEKAT